MTCAIERNRCSSLSERCRLMRVSSDTRKNSYLRIAGGLNLFFEGHRAKIQAEFASTITNANLTTTPALHQIIVQAQLAL